MQSPASPTSFAAGQTVDNYKLILTNVGSAESSGLITVTDKLPTGLALAGTASGSGWTCSAGPEIACTSEQAVPALTTVVPNAIITVPVTVEAGTSGTLINRVTVSGGGAFGVVSAETPTPIAAALPFGLAEFALELRNETGQIDGQAGDHPGSLTTSFALNTVFEVSTEGDVPSTYPVQSERQIVTELPPGVVGDAEATPTCSEADVVALEQGDLSACPPATRVGTLTLIEPEPRDGPLTELQMFNVTPERGYAAELAVYVPADERAVFLYASVVGSGAGSHIRVTTTPDLRLVQPDAAAATLFGDPAAVDKAELEHVALLTNASDCAPASLVSTIHVDSWENPGKDEADGLPASVEEPAWQTAEARTPGVSGCGALRFHPTFTLGPEAERSQADEPAGYEAVLRVPQNEDPNQSATPPLKTTTVTLPAGVAISPAAANGLVGCKANGSDAIELESNAVGHCPSASKIGVVKATTPILGQPLEGSVYVAEPTCGGAGESECTEEAAENGEVFGLYVELGSEEYGIHVKQRGTVEVGGSGHRNGLAPGQVRTTFAETPQYPVGELTFRFNGGAKAPLANPQTCGTFSGSAELEAWSHLPAAREAQGTPNATQEPTFTIEGNCGRAFAPAFSAGSISSQGDQYTSFLTAFSRVDGEDDLGAATVTLPPGLLGDVAEIPKCGEREATAGTCPAGSEIGIASAAVGSGPAPFWQAGKVYLTGPYAGAPFGLSVVDRLSPDPKSRKDRCAREDRGRSAYDAGFCDIGSAT